MKFLFTRSMCIFDHHHHQDINKRQMIKIKDEKDDEHANNDVMTINQYQHHQNHHSYYKRRIIRTIPIHIPILSILILILLQHYQINVDAFSTCYTWTQKCNRVCYIIKTTTTQHAIRSRPLTRIKRHSNHLLLFDHRTRTTPLLPRSLQFFSLLGKSSDSYDDGGGDDDAGISNHHDEDEDEEIFFGKFQANNDMIQTVANEQSSSRQTITSSLSSSSLNDETKLKIEQQQKQIDMLIEMMKNQAFQSKQHPSQQQHQPQQKSKINSSSTTNNDSLTLPPPLPGMFDNHQGEDELQYIDKDYDDLSSTTATTTTTSSPTPFSSSTKGTTTNVALAPLKVMLFIDGTWLYYSLHRRKEDHDPIVQKFGRGWQFRYKFDWNALPRIICEELVGQHQNLGWSATSSSESLPNTSRSNSRPMEIVRASVFTSYKKTTDPNSFRVKMYNEMANANYDLHMLESVGNGPEKCVDISLAVEMLHYATVPNAYDVAILLSGDKDFIPALVRTRQKGRKVGIVSMKTGCNRALYESQHIKDFNVVWIDDFLDQLLVPLPPDEVDSVVESVHDRGLLSAFTITKVIYDFIHNSPYDKVSSRDIGRYLKGLEITDGTTLLDDVKLGQGGLRRFLQDRMPDVFDVMDKSAFERFGRDFNDKSYWISIKDDAANVLLMEAKRASFTEEEKQFLKDYQTKFADGDDMKEEAYFYTIESTTENNGNMPMSNFERNTLPPSTLTGVIEKEENLTELTVVKLKEICRERGLPVSGTKATLIKRIEESKKGYLSEDPNLANDEEPNGFVDSKAKYLEDLVRYYITQSGGYVSSRDLGRFLASNKPFNSESQSALQQLKEMFGGVASFLNQRSHLFVTQKDQEPDTGDPASNYSFGVMLREGNNSSVGPSEGSVLGSKAPIHQYQTNPPRTRRARPIEGDPNIGNHIEALIKEYIKARGGVASSRDIGRYLAANAAYNPSGVSSKQSNNNGMRITALQQMKENYGSLATYLSSKDNVFETVSQDLVEAEAAIYPSSRHAFGVKLK